MSILIKNMAMPTNCDDCFLPLRLCPYAMKPNGKCPLVELPPHGRLIDADDVLERNEDDYSYFKGQDDADYAHEVLVRAIHNAPTIIPAEEGE